MATHVLPNMHAAQSHALPQIGSPTLLYLPTPLENTTAHTPHQLLPTAQLWPKGLQTCTQELQLLQAVMGANRSLPLSSCDNLLFVAWSGAALIPGCLPRPGHPTTHTAHGPRPQLGPCRSPQPRPRAATAQTLLSGSPRHPCKRALMLRL